MAEKMGFEHSDEKIKLKPVEEKIAQRHESTERGVETISAGFEKVKIKSMGGADDPEYEMDLYVIREKFSSHDHNDTREANGTRVYIGKNELEAKTRQAKGCAERQEYDGDQHDYVIVGKDGGITVYDYPDGRDYLSKTAQAKGRIRHLAKKIGISDKGRQ